MWQLSSWITRLAEKSLIVGLEQGPRGKLPEQSWLEMISTGARRRRTLAEKRRIVAESNSAPVFGDGMVCRRANCSTGGGEAGAATRFLQQAPERCPCCDSPSFDSFVEPLEVIPRQWKVIQKVREKFSCRECETNHLAMILFEKFGHDSQAQ